MTTASLPDDLTGPSDPAQLGADQGPGSAPEDAPEDMSPVMTPTDVGPNGSGSGSGQGSDFDRRRREGAAGTGNDYGAVGKGTGMGRTSDTGDDDRGYEGNGQRGGLGSAGGRDDLSDRQLDRDANPFTGGYGGGDYDQPTEEQTQHLGLHSRNPADGPAKPDEAPDGSVQ